MFDELNLIDVFVEIWLFRKFLNLHEMDRVTLRGLKNAKHMNKKQAVVLEYLEGKDRWHVYLIKEKKQVSISRKNLRKSNLFKEACSEVRNLVS